MALNSLCMPGLFYHFICLMRAWGLDFGAPPMYPKYAERPNAAAMQSVMIPKHFK